MFNNRLSLFYEIQRRLIYHTLTFEQLQILVQPGAPSLSLEADFCPQNAKFRFLSSYPPPEMAQILTQLIFQGMGNCPHPSLRVIRREQSLRHNYETSLGNTNDIITSVCTTTLHFANDVRAGSGKLKNRDFGLKIKLEFLRALSNKVRY